MYWLTFFMFFFTASASVTYFFRGEYEASMFYAALVLINYLSLKNFDRFMVR